MPMVDCICEMITHEYQLELKYVSKFDCECSLQFYMYIFFVYC